MKILTSYSGILSKKVVPLIGVLFIFCYIFTSSYAFDSITNDLKPIIAKNFKGYDVIIENDKWYDDEYFLSRYKEKVYFVGNSRTIFPFILKIETWENNSVAIISSNRYYFWFFGLKLHLLSS